MLLLSVQYVIGQSVKDTIPRIQYKLVGTNLNLYIPKDFEPKKTVANEYICKDKGSVLKYLYIKNVLPTAFCDSLTPAYFAKQFLTGVETKKIHNITIYKGYYTIGKVQYVRSFYVSGYKKGTILGVCNYPKPISELTEVQILNSLKCIHHE